MQGRAKRWSNTQRHSSPTDTPRHDTTPGHTCCGVGVPVWKVRVTSVVPSVYCPPESSSTKSPAGDSAWAVSGTAR